MRGISEDDLIEVRKRLAAEGLNTDAGIYPRHANPRTGAADMTRGGPRPMPGGKDFPTIRKSKR